MTMNRIVMTWIISSPRNRKSKRKIERKTVRYDVMVNRKLLPSMGKKKLRMTTRRNPIPPRRRRARRVSAMICWI